MFLYLKWHHPNLALGRLEPKSFQLGADRDDVSGSKTGGNPGLVPMTSASLQLVTLVKIYSYSPSSVFGAASGFH